MSDEIFPFSLSPSYGVTRDGRVFRLETGKQLSACVLKRGSYIGVSLWEGGKGKTTPVHQIVCHVFHGPRPTPKHHAAHRDGNKNNNTDTNLRWATKVENEHDKIAHGRTNRGERNGASKITDAQAADIVRRSNTFPRSSGGKRIKKGSLQQLANEYGITPNMVWMIVNGRRRTA